MNPREHYIPGFCDRIASNITEPATNTDIMPLIIEQVSQPSPQDLIDLTKIYQDYPPFADKNEADIQQWLHEQMAVSDQQLYAMRFNDRLLAAALLRQQNNTCLLHSLCVRQLTRRRGAASKLIKDIQHIAARQQYSLTIELPENQQAFSEAILSLGFSACGNNRYQWNKV
jgi:hypothetical protein